MSETTAAVRRVGSMGSARPVAERGWLAARSLRAALALLAVVLAPAAALAQSPNTWATTGATATGHFQGAGVVLGDGRALISGGRDASGAPTATVEIYDPDTGLWSPIGSMLSARVAHTATLVANGRVLFAGGDVGGTAELFDPALGTSTVVGAVPSSGGFHTATLLADGRVLVAGGAGASGTLNATRLYDPTVGPNGALVDGPALTVTRRRHSGTRLADGRVLIAGGTSAVGCRREAEVFDPSGSTMTPTGAMGVARCDHTATELADGRVLIVGGTAAAMLRPVALGFVSFEQNASPGTEAFALTNATGSFPLACSADFPVCTSVTLTGSLTVQTTGAPASVLVSSLAPGQLDFTGLPQLEFARGTVESAGFLGAMTPPTVDLFDGSTGLVFSPAVSLFSPIAPNDNEVAVIAANPTLASAELYTPGTGSFAVAGAMAGGPRTLHTATLLTTDEVLIAGGTPDEAVAHATAELFEAGSFSGTGAMATGRWGAVALRLLDGRTLVAGGGSTSGLGNVLAAELYAAEPVIGPPSNALPVANAQTVSVVQGTGNNSIVLTGADVETATANLAYTVTTSPLNGTLATTLDPQQRLYTPSPGFTGTDTFAFTVTDRGAPDACGAPGPTCAPLRTSAPATVTIEVVANTGTISSALANPAVPTGAEGAAIGDVRITETAAGVLATGSAVRLVLPPGLSFRGTPTVSLIVLNGAALSSAVLEASDVVSFTLAAASTTGPASILVSGMTVDVPAGFVPGGATSAPVLTTVSGPNPGVTPASVRNATVVAPAAGPAITSIAPATAARGATGRVVTITGANFAADATVSFGPDVTVAVSVDDSAQITATLNVAASAALGLREVIVTNAGAEQSVTQGASFAVTGPPTILTVSGPVVRGLDNQLITITGTNFGAPTTTPSNLVVTLNGVEVTVVEVGYTDATAMSAILNVDAAAGTAYDVTVINPDGGSATAVAALAVATQGLPAPPSKNQTPPPPPSPPVLASLSAPAGPIASTVTLTGTNFGSAPAVSFAGANGARLSATVTAASSSSATVTVPTGAAAGPVTVTASGLVSNGLAFAVTTPVLAAVVPGTITTDPAAVRQVVLTLSGSRFAPGAVVTFGGPAGDLTPVGSPTVAPDGTSLTLTVSVPAVLQQAGPRDVTVRNPGACTAPAPATCLASTLIGGLQVEAPPAATFSITLPGLADDATYLPSVAQVSLTRLATGACSPATKVVTPTGVPLRAQFVSGTGLTPPANVTFTLASSALPGTATNENCETDPANPARDFSVGQPSPAVQQVVVPHGGGGQYQTTLYSYDWGGKVTVTVAGTTGNVAATASRLFPVDADGDDLPDAYEKDAALNAGPGGANALSFQNSDQNGNAVKDRDDRFARDGLSNFEKYRGVYLVGPVAGAGGGLGGFERLGAGRRHLFVRGRGFRDDPAVPAGSCGINPATGAAVPDATLSAANPCPAFQVGGAFAEIGVGVHNATSSYTATTELPRVSLVNPNLPALDVATVTYDGVNCKGAETCDRISKFGVRQWGYATLGYTTPNGTATAYGGATVFKRALECYFNCRPYEHRTNDPARVLAAPDGTPMLTPITLVGDSSVTGRDNGLIEVGEATINGQLVGDTYIPGSFNRQLTALDVNNDGCIELPTAADPTTVPRCTAGTDTAPAPSATKQQVVRSILTHELGHAAGVATHTSDATDVMYLSTINFTRENHFSSTAAGLVQIHNKGLQ